MKVNKKLLSGNKPDPMRKMGEFKQRLFERIKFIDEEEELNYGSSPEGRSVKDLLEYGFIPLDKPVGQTSQQVDSWVKHMLKAEKAGHSGTLDPQVSGLLPIGLNSATKALGALLLGSKTYIAVMKVHQNIDEANVRRVLKEFTGPIYQWPPMRSAVKRQRRIKNIYEINVEEVDQQLFLLTIKCEAGTYVRKLIYDMGEVLETGATMIDLRRTRVADLDESQGFVKLLDIRIAQDALERRGDDGPLRSAVKPIEIALTHLGSIVCKDSAVESLCQGAYLAIPGVIGFDPRIRKGDTLAIYTQKGEVIALATAQMDAHDIEESPRGIVATVNRVIMKAGTYPRMWKKSDMNQ